MAKREADMAKAIKVSRKVGPKSGMVKATFSLEPEQLAALLAEAQRRAQERGAMRSDTSEVVRELMAAWMKGRR